MRSTRSEEDLMKAKKCAEILYGKQDMLSKELNEFLKMKGLENQFKVEIVEDQYIENYKNNQIQYKAKK